jgi:CxxC motif-containing protein
MSAKHEYTCINCPLSCSLELAEEEGEVLDVQGQGCKVGEKYAMQEFTDPQRVVTTTVPVRGGTLPLLPVRSVRTIPKMMVLEAARRLASVVVEAPVKGGEVIVEDILGTGVDVIASRDLEEEKQ